MSVLFPSFRQICQRSPLLPHLPPHFRRHILPHPQTTRQTGAGEAHELDQTLSISAMPDHEVEEAARGDVWPDA